MPVKVEAYKCTVCNKILINYNLRKARAHEDVPVDNTKLPVGAFYLDSTTEHTPYYRLITSNSQGLDEDHSIIHHSRIYSELSTGLSFVGSIRSDSYKRLLERFRIGLSRLLTQREFEELFSESKNIRLIEIDSPSLRIRTCPELEELASQAKAL